MPTQLRRYTVAVALPALAALMLTACGGGTTSSDENSSGASLAKQVEDVTAAQLKGTTLQLARFFGDCTDSVGTSTDAANAVGECPSITTLTNKFNAENKYGIKVERLGGATWDTYYDTLNTAFAGGNPPDVAIMHGSNLVDYARRGLLVPLDDLAAGADIDLSDTVPAAETAINYDGKNFAVPLDVNGGLIHVNVDLFKQAGLVSEDGSAKLPTSPDEFFADAQKLKQATGKDYLAIARVGDQLGVHLFESLIAQQGGDVLNADGTKSTLNSAESKTALDFLNKMFNEGYANGEQTYDAAQQSFLNGDAAILFSGTWVVDQYDTEAKFDYSAMNLFTLFDQPAVWSDAHTWVIPTQAKADPVRYRAALEFVSFLYAHNKDWALSTGHVTARRSVLDSAEYQAAPQRASYASFGQEVAHPVPHIANWPAVSKILVTTIESIWFEGVSVDKALEKGSADIDAALGS